MKAFLDDLEARISKLEKANGWDRRQGWGQLPRTAGKVEFYEFGRFAQLVDLLEELT